MKKTYVKPQLLCLVFFICPYLSFILVVCNEFGKIGERSNHIYHVNVKTCGKWHIRPLTNHLSCIQSGCEDIGHPQFSNSYILLFPPILSYPQYNASSINSKAQFQINMFLFRSYLISLFIKLVHI